MHVVLGTGPVGLATMDALVAQGQPVRLVNRSGRVSETLPDGVELVNGDLSDVATAKSLTEGASVIYFALNPPYHKWPEMFPPLQDAAVAAAEAHGAKLVVMDNLYMYGDVDGTPMTEQTPMRPTSRKGKVRAMMAQSIQDASAAGRIRVAVARSADFFGPRVLQSALGDRVIDAAIMGKAAQVLDNPNLPHTYTYMPDIGRALVILGQDDRALGQVWHVPSPMTRTTHEIIEQVYTLTGQRMKLSVPPRLGVQFMGLFVPPIREVVEMLYQFEKPFYMESKRFEDTFGMVATDWDAALSATVAWYRARNA